ncbi:MAG: DUF3592 domain-containing protein [Labilithrix sp.]|nr:DUF3592 domain-containing protein [Labilithrix sp.]MCW5812744.1 DUF3592 domain-containing protein [Labilithrix sp.]
MVLVLLGASMLLIASACGVALVVREGKRRQLAAIGTWTTGRVEMIDLDSDSGLIILAFEDATGRTRKVFASGTSSFHPRVGEPARVLYDPRDPSRAEIEVAVRTTRVALVVMTCAFGILGVGLLVSGLAR